MDYRFEISLPNSSDFRCEIAIGGDQTFQQFHDKIVDVLNYDNSQMASFFTIDKMGNRGKEIALMDMATDEEESDTLVMDSTKISDIIKPGCLELEYVFDFFTNRYFRVEYAGEYVRDSSDVMPVCVFCDGDIPEQFSFDNWEFDKPEEEFDDEDDDSFMEEFGNDSYGDEDREDRGYDEEDFREDRYESLDDYIDRL